MRRYLFFLIAVCLASFFNGSPNMVAGQPWKLPPTCQKGGTLAKAFFTQGLNYEFGVRGAHASLEYAKQQYERSLELGNPKAAINLGLIYKRMSSWDPATRGENLARMNSLYQKAIDLGCPEGYYYLSYSYAEGWGFPRDTEKSKALLRTGMEEGSVICLTEYGVMTFESGKEEEGMALLEQALNQGFSTAAVYLGDFHISHFNDSEKAVHFYREGAKLGDKICLHRLYAAYATEAFAGQPVDEGYASCFFKLYKLISDYVPPEPLDLDSKCPARPVKPHPVKQH